MHPTHRIASQNSKTFAAKAKQASPKGTVPLLSSLAAQLFASSSSQAGYVVSFALRQGIAQHSIA